MCGLGGDHMVLSFGMGILVIFVSKLIVLSLRWPCVSGPYMAWCRFGCACYQLGATNLWMLGVIAPWRSVCAWRRLERLGGDLGKKWCGCMLWPSRDSRWWQCYQSWVYFSSLEALSMSLFQPLDHGRRIWVAGAVSPSLDIWYGGDVYCPRRKPCLNNGWCEQRQCLWLLFLFLEALSKNSGWMICMMVEVDMGLEIAAWWQGEVLVVDEQHLVLAWLF